MLVRITCVVAVLLLSWLHRTVTMEEYKKLCICEQREEGSPATTPRQGQVKWGGRGEGGANTAQLTSVLILKLKTSYWLKLVFYAFIILAGFQLETQKLLNISTSNVIIE